MADPVVQNSGVTQVSMVSVEQLVFVCVMTLLPSPVHSHFSVHARESVAVVSPPPPSLVSVHAVVPPVPVQLAE
jgi:hypothetical protein